jgi:hypothetical protein
LIYEEKVDEICVLIVAELQRQQVSVYDETDSEAPCLSTVLIDGWVDLRALAERILCR